MIANEKQPVKNQNSPQTNNLTTCQITKLKFSRSRNKRGSFFNSSDEKTQKSQSENRQHGLCFLRILVARKTVFDLPFILAKAIPHLKSRYLRDFSGEKQDRTDTTSPAKSLPKGPLTSADTTTQRF